MLIEITHKNSYIYNAEVFLEPHVIRLYPRLSPYLSIVEEHIDINPSPVKMSKSLDAEGNTVLMVWFEKKTKTFMVNTKFKLEIKPFNSFDFFVHPINLGFPFEYSQSDKKLLSNYCETDEELDNEFKSVLTGIKDTSDNNITTFLILLAEYIYKNFKYAIREDGSPMSANETFAQKSGSCRDFSVLFMAAARHFGVASRFVSGYKLNNDKDEYHLHSWVEVFIPGGGWRGIDPTIGLFVNDEYVALCASYLPENTMPVFGFTRGDALAKFDYKIDIKTN